jgi:hypothetical protein
MRSFAIASLLGAAFAAPATVFTTGDAPACSVDSAGRTVVHYTNDLHPSFKCTHQSATTCSCTSNHPTHHKGGCQQFDHFASGKTLNSGGDCTDSGAWAGTCANGNLIVDPLMRTADDQCGSCDAGYALSGTSCVAFEGSCTNGALIALTSRTQANHCGSCTGNYYLNGKSCSACSYVSCGSNYNRAGSCSGTVNGFSCVAKACDSNYCNGRGTISGNKVNGCSCTCTGGWFGSTCTNKNGNWGGFSPKPGHSCKNGATTCGCDSRARYFKKEGDPRPWNSGFNGLSTGGNNGLGWGTACNGGGTIVMKRTCMNRWGSGTCANDGYGGSEHNAPCARAYHLSDLQGSFYKTSCYRCQSCFDVED